MHGMKCNSLMTETKTYTLFSELMNYTDPCTIALESDKELMKIHNPYKIIHGRVYDTKEEYEQALHDFLNEN
jgi:hypothetical protein